MSTVETIQIKLSHLPPSAQEEVLGAVEEIEARYKSMSNGDENGQGDSLMSLFVQLANIQIDGPTDLAERHDFYAHGQREE